jgi:F-type H+-transporting ATPase subunit epsilon
MQLLVHTIDRTLLDVEVNVVELPGALGRFTVLRNHDKLMSLLTEGDIRYAMMDETAADERHLLHVAGGFVKVEDNVIIVCAD